MSKRSDLINHVNIVIEEHRKELKLVITALIKGAYKDDE